MMQSAVATVNDHYRAIIEKDLDEILSKYVADEETYVVLEGPRLTSKGYTKISKGWGDFCLSSIQLTSIEWMEGPYAEQTGEMAWVSGVIRLQVQINDRSFDNIFRASFVLVRKADQWLIHHEHVSVVHPDPYGIGDWLKQTTPPSEAS
ncbi:MAG: YybH family protein [Sediminibacterium sp.]